ncbi:Uncharacterised protein [Streptococcus pneumoniae]|nr:Uncharacterised protein [Streptococcus pneumoniae]
MRSLIRQITYFITPRTCCINNQTGLDFKYLVCQEITSYNTCNLATFVKEEAFCLHVVGNEGTVLVGTFDVFNHETRIVVTEVKIHSTSYQAFLLQVWLAFQDLILAQNLVRSWCVANTCQEVVQVHGYFKTEEAKGCSIFIVNW